MSALIFVMVTIFFGRELHELILNHEKCNCFCYITIAEQCSIKQNYFEKNGTCDISYKLATSAVC